MISRKSIILLLVLAGALLFLRNQTRLTAGRTELAAATGNFNSLEAQAVTLRNQIEQLRTDLRAESAAATDAQITAARAAADFAATAPEAAWAEAPANLPAWDSQSPFIWVPKDLLTQVPLEPFSDDGRLNPAVAEILGINKRTTAELNQFVAGVLERFHNLELAHVQISTNHLPGVRDADGIKQTIELRPSAEDGARFKEEFATAFTAALGPQRAGIIMQQAQPWFAKNLAGFAVEPKIFSVVLRPKNGYSVTIKGAGTWKSVGGISELSDFVPKHLLPYFAQLEAAKPE